MDMEEKVLYKAAVKIHRAMSQFDIDHTYDLTMTIYLETAKDCKLREIYEGLEKKQEEIKKLMVSRFSHIMGPFRVVDSITCSGEREASPKSVSENYIFKLDNSGNSTLSPVLESQSTSTHL